MKRMMCSVLAALVSGFAIAADVSVSIEVGQPGFYGRIDIDGFPHPELIFPHAVIIKPVGTVVRSPIYLHVPPGHAKDWRKHCHKYNACGERVFFVREHWYNDIYVPEHQKRKTKPAKGPKDKGHGEGRGKGKGKE